MAFLSFSLDHVQLAGIMSHAPVRAIRKVLIRCVDSLPSPLRMMTPMFECVRITAMCILDPECIRFTFCHGIQIGKCADYFFFRTATLPAGTRQANRVPCSVFLFNVLFLLLHCSTRMMKFAGWSDN